MEKKNNRRLWGSQLIMKFSESLKQSSAEFTWQEKTDFLEAMIEYVELTQNNAEEAATFFGEKLMKSFKTKLQPAIRARLFKFFDQELALVELDIIDTRTFNSLQGDQGMSDEEYKSFLHNVSRLLKTEQYEHFIYHKEEKTEPQAENLGTVPGAKGRLKRSPGDNLTKLNQEQTALLIHFLKMGRLVLKDEYLTDKAAGMAFNILTGYSPDSLRTSLSEKGIAQLSTRVNLTELYNSLIHVTNLMDKELKALKKT